MLVAKRRMVSQSFLLSQLVWLYCCVYVMGQVPCTQRPSGTRSCVCQTDEGIIDLTTIANSDGTPRFKGITGDTHGYDYSYNPCYGYGFVGTDGCNGVNNAACQDEKDTTDLKYSCGAANTETFMIYSNGNNKLEYTGGLYGRTTEVELICDRTAKTPQLTANDDSPDHFVYIFQLRTECACPGVCADAPPPSGGGTAAGEVGLILIFLGLGALIAYFVIGALILKFKFNRTGAEIIPHRKFWFALPYMIKDGCLFTYRSIVGLFRKNESNTYEKL